MFLTDFEKYYAGIFLVGLERTTIISVRTDSLEADT
jgi:hypothetical protein